MEPSATAAPHLRRQLVARKWCVALTRAREKPKRSLDITFGGAFREVLLGAQRRDLLSDGDVYELVYRHAVGLGDFAGFSHQ